MSGPKVLVIGATSAIAEAVVRTYATSGAQLYLLARDRLRVQAIAADLVVRGAQAAHVGVLDVTSFEGHSDALARAWNLLGAVDVALIAHGTLPDQARCDRDADYALREFTINATSTVILAGRIAQWLEAQRHGTLVVISSVAGDRGRASNALYGASKAAVSTCLSGLRQRLGATGVNVLTVKPGFVDTPMTARFTKGPIWATPERVARGIRRAIDRRRSVVYIPWFWRPVMFAIRCIPEPVFRRMRF